ncbi:MAG: S41 family peptidase [Defluviitaleaceae bacterium]|nr:S41 family peptidase [Defluviitaleaceae bacterium]
MPIEDMIYDFEYLITALEENWPFFNLSISANNVDVQEHANNTRALLDAPDANIDCPIDFLEVIHEHFFEPIDQLGHLRPVRFHEYVFDNLPDLRLRAVGPSANRNEAFLYEMLTRPDVTVFYSRLMDSGRGVAPTDTSSLPVMEFDIIEYGEIAHISINRMINVWDDTINWTREMYHYQALMFDFNYEIKDFEHLIFDFRGNWGGISFHFDWFVLSKFIHEEIQLPAYVFYLEGNYTAQAKEIFDMRTFYPDWYITDPEFNRFLGYELAMEEVFLTHSLPYMDIEINFANTFLSMYTMSPWHYVYGSFRGARDRVLFNGHIWVLTDEYTASAAESAVAQMKLNNIATVVGEPTRGIFGTLYDATRIHLSLPNTGILVMFDVGYYTDHYGRPLQGYGIQPHYHNRPGMDALETVLAMINEGSY